MDREQEEMQFTGFFGIFKESFRIIFTWVKIFTQITLSLILPLAFIFLAEIEISDHFFSNFNIDELELDFTLPGIRSYPYLTQFITAKYLHYFLFKFAYFTFLLIFSLLSTSAVVYTIASIYTGNQITFKKVISVVPRVWKRLMVTFLCMFLAFFVYHIVAIIVSIIWEVYIAGELVGSVLIIVILILYTSGFVYMTIVWQLASVVSVLENVYGLKSMTKAMKLIKGQRIITIVIFFLLNLILIGIEIGFEILVLDELDLGLAIWKRIGFGILFMLLLIKLFLFGLVIQTVIYLVCKSYHHENIDKPSLADHLDSYFGDYERLVNKDVQLEQIYTNV